MTAPAPVEKEPASEMPSPVRSSAPSPASPPAAERKRPLLRDTSTADALLPPSALAGMNGAARAVPLPMAPVPLPEFDQRSLPENPDQTRLDALFDPEQAALLRLKDPTTKVIQAGDEVIELRRLSPEERAARRRKYNLIMVATMAVIVAIVLLIGLNV